MKKAKNIFAAILVICIFAACIINFVELNQVILTRTGNAYDAALLAWKINLVIALPVGLALYSASLSYDSEKYLWGLSAGIGILTTLYYSGALIFVSMVKAKYFHALFWVGMLFISVFFILLTVRILITLRFSNK